MYTNILKMGSTLLAVAFVFTLFGCGGGAEKMGTKELLAKAQELQQGEKYEDAIRIYRKLVREYPETRQGINSQFMIGYIYANHLKDLEQAKIELNRFLESYSEKADSGLVAGAKFELDYLGKDISDIPVLTDMGGVDTSAAIKDGTK
ncbi:MAG: tetratricopeptide repeat protein [Candidatus Hatepunaea meridiana]|nr:tetratricopeptide repeat protein [Candidatus Hatepunaea meridiana]